MNSAISIPSLEVDRGFLDSFVEVLPTTSDFQALFYSTGAKFAADVVAAEPASEPIVESSSASIPEVPTIARTSPPTMVASVPPHVAPMHSFALPFHPHHAPASYAAFLGRPGLTNLDPEWQRREVALQKLQAATAVMQPPVVVPSIHSTEVISNSLAATVPIISANSSQQPVVPTAVPEHKPHTKNLSAAAKERRRYAN